MKNLIVITGVITCLSLLSTLICGLWIKANQVTEVSSLNFHMNSGILSVVLVCAFVVCVCIYLLKK
ncbi:MAG TPA: hypothetical protein DCQ90_08210 [Erysipelotrichaceae bacterium]|nr:hypothetical protein [Erysipelotrichaceae bacterium]